MLKESIIFPLRSIQSKTYVWFDIVGLTNKTTGKKNKPVDSSPGKQKRKAKLLCSLLSFSWDWKVNWPREVSYGIRGPWKGISGSWGDVEPAVAFAFDGEWSREHTPGFLGLCSKSLGLLLPPQVWLPWSIPSAGLAAHRDHVGPSGPTECFQDSEILLLGGQKMP